MAEILRGCFHDSSRPVKACGITCRKAGTADNARFLLPQVTR